MVAPTDPPAVMTGERKFGVKREQLAMALFVLQHLLVAGTIAAAAVREYGIFTGLQYYGPPAAQSIYDRVRSRQQKGARLHFHMCRPQQHGRARRNTPLEESTIAPKSPVFIAAIPFFARFVRRCS